MPLDLSPQALQRQAILQQMQSPEHTDNGGVAAAPPQPPAPSGGIGIAPYAALLGGQGADIASTIAAMRNPNLREGNPMGTPGVIGAKLGMTLMVAMLMKKLAKTHPGIAKAYGYLGGVEGAIPAAMNLHTMSQNPND